MKISCYIGLFLLWISHIYPIDEKILIQKIDEQNTKEIIQLFEDSRDITLKEAKELLQRVYHHYNQPFERKILQYEQEEIIDFIKDTYLDSFVIFGLNMKDSFLRHYTTVPTPEAPIDELQLFFGRNNIVDIDMSRPMVLGGTEIFIGVLVWILPCPGAKYVGSILISDGITRAFDCLEKADRKNRLAKSIKQNENIHIAY